MLYLCVCELWKWAVFSVSCSTCVRLGAVLWNASVPFLVCRTYGLTAYMRLVVREHTGMKYTRDTGSHFVCVRVYVYV